MYKKFLFILGMVCLINVADGKPELSDSGQGNSFQLYQELGLRGEFNFSAFDQALSGYHRYATEKDRLLVLIDYTKPSTEKRFYVVDLLQKQVLFASHVAHGRGSGENYAVSFSNKPGSYQSSLGFFRTGETYYGKNGYSLILDGLEDGVNDKARERAIVIHGANYADPLLLDGQKRLGRSLGCPALPPAVNQQVINTIKDGVLLYIYGHNKA